MRFRSSRQHRFDVSATQINATEMLERRVLLAAIPVVNWVQDLGSLRAVDVTRDSAGNFYMVGWSYGAIRNVNYFMAKCGSDGTLLWSKDLGENTANAVAVDKNGDVYIGGGGPSVSGTGGGDAYVARYRPDGTLVWSRILGGGGVDSVEALAVDASGNLYLAGGTDSPDFAKGGYDTTFGGGYRSYGTAEGFAAKMDAQGNLAWSTYLGGSGGDRANDLAIDAAGNVYITGDTSSPDWISGGSDTSYNGGTDGFLVKLAPSGALGWSSYFGGAKGDMSFAVAVDPHGGVYAVGRTLSTEWAFGGFASRSPYIEDGFVTRFSPDGRLQSAHYIGGEWIDEVNDVAVDDAGRVFVVGDMYAPGALEGGLGDADFGSPCDGFAAEIRPDGTMVWSTYLGANGYDFATHVLLDGSGAVYVLGAATSIGWANGELYENEPKYPENGYIARTRGGAGYWD